MRAVRRGRLTLATAVLAVSLAGCLDVAVSAPPPTPTRAPEPTPTTSVYEPATTVWYEGLLVHVDRIAATLDERGGPVDVTIRVENPAAEATDLAAPIRLLVDGTALEPTRDSEVPSIPAGGLVGAVLTFELQSIPSIDDAIILIGSDPRHIGRVPLSAAGGTPVVFQPVPLELSGSATAGDLRVRLKAGLLRWDLPDWSQQLDDGLQALTLTYDVTYLGAFAGGYAFTGENVRLRLPNGTLVEPRRDGHSQSIELIRARKTKADLSSRFEIPAGTTGRFALVVLDHGTQKAVGFTLGG